MASWTDIETGQNMQSSLEAPQGIVVPVPQEQPTPTITVAPSNTSTMVSANEADARARRYSDALGQQSPGVDVLRQRVQMGHDSLMRAEYSMAMERDLIARRAQTINTYLQNREPGDVRDEEISYIRGVASGELARIQSDPRTFFEARRASQVNQQVAETPAAERARQSNERLFQGVNESARRVQTLQEYAQFRLEALESEARNQATGPWAADVAGGLLSPLQWWRQSGRMGTTTSSFFLGNNQREQAAWYYNHQNPKAAIDALDLAVDSLKGQNLLTALDFIHAIANNDQSTYALNNFFSFLDVAPGIGFVPYKVTGLVTLAALGKAGIRSGATHTPPHVIPGLKPGDTLLGAMDTPGVALNRARQGIANLAEQANAAADAAQAAVRNRTYPNNAPIAEAAGDLQSAGRITAGEQIRDFAGRTGQVDSLDGLRGYGVALFNPDQVLTQAGTNLSNQEARKIRIGLNKNSEKLLNGFLRDPVRISHLTPGSLTERMAAEEAQRIALNHQYNHIADRVIDVSKVIPPSIEELPKAVRAHAERSWVLERQLQEGNKLGEYHKYILNRTALNNSIMEMNKISGAVSKVNPKTGNVTLKRAMAKVEVAEAKEQLSKFLAVKKEAEKYEKSIPKADRDLFFRTLKSSADYESAAAKINMPNGLQRPKGYGNFMPENKGPDIIQGMGNVKYASIKFGDHGGLLFSSANDAEKAALKEMNLRPNNFRVGQQGAGYYVEVQKALPVNAEATRSALAIETAMEGKGTPRPLFTNQLVNRIRGADYKRSRELTEDAKVAVYGSANLYDKVSQVVNEAIGALPKLRGSSRQDLISFLEHQRMFLDPTTKERGLFSTNQWELEKQWLDHHGRLPNGPESMAYWTYVQISNLDKVILDLGIYRDKAISGMEHFWFPLGGLNPEIPYLEGKLLAGVPEQAARDRNAGFVIWNGNPSTAEHLYYNTRGAVSTIQSYINKGYKIVQMSPYGADDLKAIPGMTNEIMGSRVNFVLSQNIESVPLPYQQTPNKAGGHHTYLYEHYVKQPDLRNQTYYGDMTMRGFLTQGEAAAYQKNMNEAAMIWRRLRAGDQAAEAELATHVERNLPDSLKTIKTNFENGSYNADAPFLTTRQGQRTADVHKLENFYGRGKVNDILNDPLSLYQSTNLRYALERSGPLTTVVKRGTEANPVHDIALAPMVDVMTTMDTAIKHLANNMHLGDYQVKTTERFIAEFNHLLEPKYYELLKNPLDALVNPVWKADANPTELRAAMNFRDAAMEMMKIRDPVTRDWDAVRDKLANSLQRTVGTEVTQTITASTPYKTITRPVDATKNAVMRYFLMAPRQLFIQAAGVLNVAGSSSWLTALEGMSAAMYGRIVRDYTGAKGMLEYAAEQTVGFGWKREDFQEAYKLGERMGAFKVNHTYALVDSFDSATIRTVKDTGAKVLDLGMTPFRMGEEFVRHTAWWAAYREWRVANPGVGMTDEFAKGILGRMDDMIGNMSPASMSSTQHTIMKLPTTFWSYNQRIWERMLDMTPGSMTAKEKTLMMLNYGILLGAPAAVGIPLFGVPVYDYLNNWLLKQEIPVNNETPGGFLLNVAMNGMLGVGLEKATGTRFNAPQTMSPSNSRIITDLLKDKDGWEFFLGASGSMFREIYLASYPFVVALADTVKPPGDRDAFEIRNHHITDWLQTQRGVSQVWKAYWAMTTGELISRSAEGVQDSNMNTIESVILGLTGMTPQRVQDAYGIIANNKSLKELQEYHTKQIERSFRSFLRATGENDLSTAEKHQRDIRIAFAMGRFNESQKNVTMNRILNNNGSLVERTMQRAGRNTPAGEALYRSYQRALENRGN